MKKKRKIAELLARVRQLEEAHKDAHPTGSAHSHAAQSRVIYEKRLVPMLVPVYLEDQEQEGQPLQRQHTMQTQGGVPTI